MAIEFALSPEQREQQLVARVFAGEITLDDALLASSEAQTPLFPALDLAALR